MLFVFDDHGGGVAHREATSDAVALEVGVLPQVGVATLIAGLGIGIYDACVDKCFAVLDQAISAEPPSLFRWPPCRRVARSRRAERWPLTPAAGLHRQGRDFAGAHEAFLTDELAKRVRRQSGSAQGPVEGGALILLHGKPRGNAVDGQERWACPQVQMF